MYIWREWERLLKYCDQLCCEMKYRTLKYRFFVFFFCVVVNDGKGVRENISQGPYEFVSHKVANYLV